MYDTCWVISLQNLLWGLFEPEVVNRRAQSDSAWGGQDNSVGKKLDLQSIDRRFDLTASKVFFW